MIFWFAVLIIGGMTYATRVLPLIWPARRFSSSTRRPQWLEALGPCLLTSMAVTVIFPAVTDAADQTALLPLICGFAAVGAVMLLRSDPGLATLAGMMVWWLMA